MIDYLMFTNGIFQYMNVFHVDLILKGQISLFVQTMKKSLLILLILTVTSFAYEEEGNILVLHDADLPKVFEDFDYIMIEFYAPQDENCLQFEPIYKEIADELKAQGSDVRLAKVDSTVDIKCTVTYKFLGFPTIYFFHKGEPIGYKGQKTKKYMLNWLLKKIKDPLVPIDQAAYEKLASANEVNIVFHGDANSEQGKIVSKLATVDNYNTYSIISGVEGKTEGYLELFRPFDSVAVYESVDENLEAWISRSDRPPVVQFDSRTIQDIFSNSKSGVCLFDKSESNALLDAFTKSASKYLDSGKSLIFTRIKSDNEQFGPFSENLKINPDQTPVVLIDIKIESKFVLQKAPSDVTAQSISEFLESWESGNATKYGYEDEVAAAETETGQL